MSQPSPPDYHIVATASRADERTRVLMHGETFVVMDHHGDMEPTGLGEQGLFHAGTRHLSRLRLTMDGQFPFFLGSPVRDDADQLVIAMTNAERIRDGKVAMPMGTIHLSRRAFLHDGTCYLELQLTNHGSDPIAVGLEIAFAADWSDIFEVRGAHRAERGEDLAPEVEQDRVVLGYRGLDDVVRRTVLAFKPRPTAMEAGVARISCALDPGEESMLRVTISCERGRVRRPLPFGEARSRLIEDRERDRTWSSALSSSNPQVNTWIDRAISDLRVMTARLPTGPYPYAGVPWFNTPFGRDGLLTALQCLWLRPALAGGVLRYLASTQATAVEPARDAEPGKILHEAREGEMAALGEVPFGRYYGTVDATPLFVVLAGAYYDRTGDRGLIAALWPQVSAALEWIDTWGDRDRDGFVEYERRTPAGLRNQGWKDSDDALFHADGTLAEGPIAMCEVQGYVYAALRAGEHLARVLGDEDRGRELEARANQLQEAFDKAFWCEELGTYAIALDGEKRRCAVRTSNAGQLLFTGIVKPARARKLARTLLRPESFSGWGIRTVAAGQSRYNPMSYHNGSVWPHDNALIAWGLGRCGFEEQALRIWMGQFEAASQLDLFRMPELYCGFPREGSEGPVLYPVACSPQAWSAAAVPMLFQACLGLSIDGVAGRICFTRPILPDAVRELRIDHLEVGEGVVDLVITRHARDVGVEVVRRDGDVRITLVK